MSSMPATEDAVAIRRRLVKLAAELYRPLTKAIQTTLLAGVLAVIAGLAVGLLSRQPTLAGVAAIVVTAIGVAIAWLWLLDGNHRAVLELVLDHTCHERWEWKE
jgi:uncharacterized membrane protein